MSCMSSHVKSRWHAPLPQCSLPYFVFGPPQKRLSKEKILIDAERPERALSLDEYRRLSRRVAVGLLRLGLQPEDRVVCFSRNELCYPALLMGTIMAGGILTPANPAYNAHELGHLMQYVEARVLFTNRHLLPTALEAAEQAGLSRDRVFVFDDDIIDGTGSPEGDIQHWQTMVASDEDGSNFRYKGLLSKRKYNSTIMIMFTSGTTGDPKGVQISHRNLITAAMAFIQRLSLDPEWYENRHSRHALGSLHMSHLMAHRTCSVIFPKLRVPTYVLRRNDYIAVLEAVEKYGITDALVRSSAVMEMAKHIDVCRRYNLRTLQHLEACAAPLSQEAKIKLEELGIGRVSRVWGLTETGTATGHHPLERDDTTSVGELHANYEAKVTDPADENRVLNRNEIGDIWLRGPSTTAGYWKNEEATQQLRGPDGWVRTGDVGYVDENGKWYIVDRKKVSDSAPTCPRSAHIGVPFV